jgi:predicted PurR-regulated permease PerM
MNKTGRRIWYGTAIALSGLVLLLCVLSVAGVWLVESVLSNTVVEVIEAVDVFTGNLRGVIEKVDQGVERMQETSISISDASAQLAEQVTDEGLILLLLPEEQEQNLTEMAASLQETVDTLRSFLAAGVAIYHSIDRIPFIDLPSPSEEQVGNIQETVGEIQSLAENVETQITDFRSGVSDQIGKVESGADAVTSKLDEVRASLSGLDSQLATLQESLVKLQKTILTALVLGAILMTLILAWVIYSQVEVLRLYARRWKVAGDPGAVAEALPEQVSNVEAENPAVAPPPAPENSDNES